jgi:carotenoid cleavage dioxygenase-like enzyme
MFAIKDGRVFFRNKFVRTEALMREQEAQKVRQCVPCHDLHAQCTCQKLCW